VNAINATSRTHWPRADFAFLAIAIIIPIIELTLPESLRVGSQLRQVFIFAILGLGLNIVTGFTGLLHLGVAAFMAIGAYAYAILSCEIYPFRLGFWGAIAITPMIGAIAGLLLGAPTLRLRGDYLAIVTLGFGEIVQDVLRNLETITRGTQSINPVPRPSLWGDQYQPTFFQMYYVLLGMLILVVVFSRHVENSRLGRAFVSIREDELASTCMGVNTVKIKLLAFALGAAVCALAGGLFAGSLGSTAEPGTYDFQISILAVSIVIVGGLGNISGVLLGALVMMGLTLLVFDKLTGYLESRHIASSANVFSNPNNWKLMVYGLALVLMMRYKPEGLLPSRRVKAELHHDDPPAGSPVAGAAQSESTGAKT
jgi:branched-chain amino acid transport system permease protein